MTDRDVIVVDVFKEPLLGQGLLGVFDKASVMKWSLGSYLWRSSLFPVYNSSAEVRMVPIHVIKEVEGVGSMKILEMKRKEMK